VPHVMSVALTRPACVGFANVFKNPFLPLPSPLLRLCRAAGCAGSRDDLLELIANAPVISLVLDVASPAASSAGLGNAPAAGGRQAALEAASSSVALEAQTTAARKRIHTIQTAVATARSGAASNLRNPASAALVVSLMDPQGAFDHTLSATHAAKPRSERLKSVYEGTAASPAGLLVRHDASWIGGIQGLADAEDIATLASLKIMALDRAQLITMITKAMVKANDQYAAVMERARVTHLAALVDDLLAGDTSDFLKFTLESAACVPSTLPMWSVSIVEVLAYVRDEYRSKLWSPARYVFVSVVSGCVGLFDNGFDTNA